MTTAADNLAKLPEWCYAVNNTSRDIIAVRAGMSGYHPLDDYQDSLIAKGIACGVLKPPPAEFPATRFNGTYDAEMKYKDEIADTLNREIFGITKAQRAAIECGSYAGRWDLPGCNPDNYDDNGRRRKDK